MEYPCRYGRKQWKFLSFGGHFDECLHRYRAIHRDHGRMACSIPATSHGKAQCSSDPDQNNKLRSFPIGRNCSTFMSRSTLAFTLIRKLKLRRKPIGMMLKLNSQQCRSQ